MELHRVAGKIKTYPNVEKEANETLTIQHFKVLDLV